MHKARTIVIGAGGLLLFGHAAYQAGPPKTHDAQAAEPEIKVGDVVKIAHSKVFACMSIKASETIWRQYGHSWPPNTAFPDGCGHLEKGLHLIVDKMTGEPNELAKLYCLRGCKPEWPCHWVVRMDFEPAEDASVLNWCR
jgi:hypothetical protein